MKVLKLLLQHNKWRDQEAELVLEAGVKVAEAKNNFSNFRDILSLSVNAERCGLISSHSSSD